jgi:hypothetical protein
MERIRLDIIPKGLMPVCHASQYDAGRVIRLDLMDGLQGYSLTDEEIELDVRKPDGHIVTASVDVVAGNTFVDIVTTEQMCAVEGENICELKISKDGAEIYSLNFRMMVEKSVTEGGDPSDSFIHNLRTQIAEGVAEEVATQYDSSNVIFDEEPTDNHGIGYTVTSEGIKTAIDNAFDYDNTASGSLVHITDGADNIPLKSCVVTINTNTAISKLKLYHEYEINSWADISKLVKSGDAPDLLPVGSIITDKWQNGSGGTIYDYPWIVSNYDNYEKADGTTAFGMVLQAQYCEPIGMPFSGYPALLACPNGLSSGTYHFKCSGSWGNITANTDYEFTLTQDIPNGGLVCAPQNWADVALANWKITTYASNTATTPIETVSLTTGSGGTDLGTFTPAYQSATMNGYQTSAYGYNRWSKSAIRQWLNSSSANADWWTPQTTWDMAPTKASQNRGFLAGFSSDFLDVLPTMKIKTALNNADKATEGIGYEYTNDKLFLPALEEMYINPQATGTDSEGSSWQYYEDLNGTDTKFAQYGTYPELIKYNLSNHSSAVNQPLRSATRGGSYLTWNVYTSGSVNGSGAITALPCAPACIII